MLICKQCGGEIIENSRFCRQCGAPVIPFAAQTPETAEPPLPKSVQDIPIEETSAPDQANFCGKCGAVLPANLTSCVICGTKAGEAPPDEPEPPAFAVPARAANTAAVRSAHNKRLVAVCVFICALLALSALSLYFIQALPYMRASSKTRANGAVIYVTADKKLKFKTASLQEPEELASDYHAQLKESGAGLAKSSANGRYIAYLNEYLPIGDKLSGQLFLRDFGKAPPFEAPGPSGALVAENVTNTFFFTDNSAVLIYLTMSGDLYANNFEGEWLLDSGVTGVIDYSDSRILYAKTTQPDSGEAKSGVYLRPIAAGSEEKTLIDSDVLQLADYTPDFVNFIYLRDRSGETREIIAYDAKLGTHRTLAVGVDKIIEADAKTSAILYQTENANSFRYESLIIDDLYASDESLKEPDIEDYPLLKQINERGLDEDSSESSGDAQDIIDSEDLADENARYHDAVEAYAAKTARDALRGEVESAIDAFVSKHPKVYDLYLGLDDAPIRIAENSYLPFDSASIDVENRLAVWTHAGFRGMKKIPLSQYKQSLEGAAPKEFLSGKIAENLYFQQFGRDTVPLYVGDGICYTKGWQLTEKCDGIYFATVEESPFSKRPESACALYYAAIKNGTAGNIVLVDENAAGIVQMMGARGLLYYKELLGDVCDLYITNGTSGEKIGDNITLLEDFFQIKNSGKTLLYCERFDSSAQSGDLMMLTKQKRQLATEVHRFFYRNDGSVYFLRGFKDGKGDLYSFGSDGIALIDENVVAVME